MPPEQRSYVVACVALCGGALCYMLCDFGQWPTLMYEPYQEQFFVARQPPSAATMAYPGMLLWGVVGWIVAAVLAILGSSRISKPLSRARMALLGLWTLTLVLLVAGYFLWGLWPF